jgi:hypothetical protein
MAVRLSALSAGCTLLSGRFWVLIYVRNWVQPRVAGRIRSIETSNDLIGIRIRDLPAFSIFPQLHYRVDPSESSALFSECLLIRVKWDDFDSWFRSPTCCFALVMPPWRRKYKMHWSKPHDSIVGSYVLLAQKFEYLDCSMIQKLFIFCGRITCNLKKWGGMLQIGFAAQDMKQCCAEGRVARVGTKARLSIFRHIHAQSVRSSYQYSWWQAIVINILMLNMNLY